MMTLDEAINHARNEYEEQMDGAKAVLDHYGQFAPGYHKHCECAKEHKQLMDWLSDVKESHRKLNEIRKICLNTSLSKEERVDQIYQIVSWEISE